MTKISKKALEERGYQYIDTSGEWYTYENLDGAYQKVFKDDYGKKYFVEFRHFTAPSMNMDTYEGQTDIYRGGTSSLDTEMRIIFFSDDLDEIEKKCEDLWNWNGRGYYEKYH